MAVMGFGGSGFGVVVAWWRGNQMLDLSGVSALTRWSSVYVWGYIAYAPSVALLLLAGGPAGLALSIFSCSDTLIWFQLLVAWGAAEIGLGVLLAAAALGSAHVTNVLANTFLILSSLVSLTACALVFPESGLNEAPLAWLLLPTLAHGRACFLLASRGYTYEEAFADDAELGRCIRALAIEAVVYFVLAVAAEQLRGLWARRGTATACLVAGARDVRARGRGPAVPGLDFTILAPPVVAEENRTTQRSSAAGNFQLRPGTVIEETELPDDVRAERTRSAAADPANTPLIVRRIGKAYADGFRALSDVSLAVPRGECLVILGPNGAGKSTLFRLLTGVDVPSEGTALIGGADVCTHLAAACRRIGVCPQFDVQWPELTVCEHLEFYARLQPRRTGDPLPDAGGGGGAAPAAASAPSVAARALAAAHSVRVDGRHYHKRSLELSGGMRRRVQLAISLVHEPEVVLLDEPSSGLDPESRLHMWRVVRALRERGTAVVLTTHAMAEAEALGTRVALLSRRESEAGGGGTLRCIGTAAGLRSRLGAGRHVISVASLPGRAADIEELVARLVPRARLTFSLRETRSYTVEADDIDLGAVLTALGDRAAATAAGVEAWALRQTSLADVFHDFVAIDKGAAAPLQPRHSAAGRADLSADAASIASGNSHGGAFPSGAPHAQAAVHEQGENYEEGQCGCI